MERRYDSFVLRRWQCDGECRMAVEHLQSGGCLRNATLAAAIGWIGHARRSANGGARPDLIARRFESSRAHSQPSNSDVTLNFEMN